MPSRSLSAVAADLARAADADAAVQVLAAELAGEKQVGVVVLRFDPRRQALHRARDDRPADERDLLALDHLPAPVQYALLAGQRFAEIGTQGGQYARLLGVDDGGAQELRLFLKGMVLDGALAAVLAVYDGRRRAPARLLERVEPLALLFELAYGRLYERDARFEAVAALHDVTSRLRAEHTSAMAALERELARLRQAVASDESPAAAELRRAAERNAARASAAEGRLAAVEEQVASAVERLDRAHLQLHQQAGVIQEQAETIRRLQDELARVAQR